jgi:hypothetical protein
MVRGGTGLAHTRVGRLRAPLGQALEGQPRRADSITIPQLWAFRPGPASRRGLKAVREVGWPARPAAWLTLAMVPYRCALRAAARRRLRLSGRHPGARVVATSASSTSTGGSGGLRVGDECFLGDDCLWTWRQSAWRTVARRARSDPTYERRLPRPSLRAHFPPMSASSRSAGLFHRHQRHDPAGADDRRRLLRGRGQRRDARRTTEHADGELPARRSVPWTDGRRAGPEPTQARASESRAAS